MRFGRGGHELGFCIAVGAGVPSLPTTFERRRTSHSRKVVATIGDRVRLQLIELPDEPGAPVLLEMP